MELIVIELFLWVGLIVFFWALKDGLSHVETDIEDLGLFGGKSKLSVAPAQFVRPEQMFDPIGHYLDAPIYQYAIIDGQYYRFDRVCPTETRMAAQEDERYILPGLVYVLVSEREQPAF